MKLLLKSIQICLILLGIGMPSAYAQLGFCSGNSGNPIFTENFGTGTGQSALPSGNTTYSYANGISPEDGFYTVSNTTNFFDWFVIQDHTANDSNGRMLIINSDFNSGQFYRTTINGLCANTSYEFSSWLINLTPSNGFCGSGAIPINVGFEIWDNSDSNLLASGNTGSLGSTFSPQWLQYALVFQTLPGQTSVILKMKNNGTGGCGNDLAIDDIVFKTCGDSVILENNNGDNSYSACESEMVMSVPLTAIPDFSVFSTHAYQWQVSNDGAVWNDIAGATNNTFNAPAPTPSGILYYRVKFAESAGNLQNSSCNSISEVFVINISPLVTPNFNAIPAVCMGDSFNLPTTSLNDIDGTWSPTPNNMSTTTYTFSPVAGECATSQTLTIIVNQAVTPNFDSVAPICSGEMLMPLPTMSNNNITGTWSPSLDNTATTTYTFTPAVGECSILAFLTIGVNPLPIIDLDDFYAICTNTNGTEIFQTALIDTNLSATDYSFEWTNSMNELVGTEASYTPMDGGEYSILVTDLSTGCQNEDRVTVVEISAPELTLTFTSPSFSDNGTITVDAIGNGDYEYNLDDGPWQNSPNFNNVSAGNHIVLARDKKGCGFSSIEVCLIGTPKFFTPNGDGINDTWNIKGVSCIDNANVYIFDRYGKLLKEMGINGLGWNGIFNEQVLPSDDYWFVINYLETGNSNMKEFKGHFTLKR